MLLHLAEAIKHVQATCRGKELWPPPNESPFAKDVWLGPNIIIILYHYELCTQSLCFGWWHQPMSVWHALTWDDFYYHFVVIVVFFCFLNNLPNHKTRFLLNTTTIQLFLCGVFDFSDIGHWRMLRHHPACNLYDVRPFKSCFIVFLFYFGLLFYLLSSFHPFHNFQLFSHFPLLIWSAFYSFTRFYSIILHSLFCYCWLL